MQSSKNSSIYGEMHIFTDVVLQWIMTVVPFRPPNITLKICGIALDQLKLNEKQTGILNNIEIDWNST